MTTLQQQLSSFQENLDLVWMIAACAMVFLMQVGFLLIEAGMVRSKNSINVAQKNLADFALSLICFSVLGFMVMFGPSIEGLIGFDVGFIGFDHFDDKTYAFFLFQALFCGTAATIMSGVVAERMRLSAYLMAIPVVTIIIYPVVGHWTWGDLLSSDNAPFLASWGFIDFAGATVVHAVGAWIGLAALIIIGPRLGRFDDNGRPTRIQGHSMVLATLGLFFIWFGWIGFNGGSALAGTAVIAPIIVKTVIAGAFGGVTGLLWGHIRDTEFQPHRMMNGVLAGLVAVTAGCDLVTGGGAVVLGITGSWLALVGMELMERCGLDDAVGAIPVHGFAGVWGTIAVALVAPEEALPLGSRGDQFMVQLVGSVIVFGWVFAIAFLTFKIIDFFWGLRIDAAGEMAGLNQAEHGATLGTGELQKLLAGLAQGRGDLKKRLDVEPGEEAAELVTLFNLHLDNLEVEQQQQRLAEEKYAQVQKDLEQEKYVSELQRGFVSMASHEFRTPLAIIDGNAQQIERKVDRLSAEDVTGRVKTIRYSVKRMMRLMESMLTAAKAEAGKIKLSPASIDLRAILLDCCELQQEITPGHRVIVDHAALPDEIIADSGSVTQIITNLLSNAAKYSPEADRIDVRGWRHDDNVFISVQDYGIGIDEHEQAKMFTRFFRAKTSVGIAGTGIGLNLAQMLAKEHGGAITLVSKAGEGSTFTLRLPCDTAAPDAA
ncbi:MAG: ammonium transporter [Pseudomonadota bacterium]